MDAEREDWQRLSERVLEVTGRPLPPPGHAGSAEFDALMTELRRKDPVLWRQVLDAATGPLELPVEREAASERRRRRVLSVLFSLISRPDGLRTGRRRLNGVVLLTAGAAAILLVSVLAQGDRSTGLRRAEHSRDTRPGKVSAGITPALVRPAPTPVRPAPAPVRPAPTAPGVPARAPGDTGTQALPGSAGPGRDALPLPPAVPEDAVPQPVLPPPPPEVQPRAGVPDQGSGQSLQPTVSPVLFRQQRTQSPSGPVLFRREGVKSPQEARHLLHRAGSRPEGASGSALLFKPPAAGGEDGAGERAAVLFRQPPSSPDPTRSSSADRSDADGQVRQAPEARPPLVHTGQLVSAKLALPVSTSPAWGEVPVLAEVTEGPGKGLLLWGRARMARDGSIEITFHQVMDRSGNSASWSAVAYDAASGRVGVSGRTETVMPGALQTLLSSSLRAASEYFRAKVESKQVTITNGFVTIRSGEPAFWDVYLRELAGAMTPRVPAGSGPVVVSRLPAGTTIQVIAMAPLYWHVDRPTPGR